ncbi:MAG TPA: Crp/Fnr family transcriptional regulator [Prolixibacteraceae bacterium]|nr:Crp/Fnr family transcriptional regulator [Prolixibacteraceae bacterium]
MTHIFNNLSKQELRSIMDNKRQIRFRAGETIIKQNTPLTHLVCIRSGMAKVVSEGPKGKNLIVDIIKDNNIFTGGGTIIDDSHHFTVAALTDIECCFIETSKMFNVLSVNSMFAMDLMRLYNGQHIKMHKTLINLIHKYMPGRVADTLLYLKNEVYLSNPFQFVLTKQELAEMSGMTKESFIRNLKEFEDSGIINHSRNTINVIKEEDLIEISRNG